LEYLELCNSLFMDVNPIPVKEALIMMGFDVGECRMPLAPLSDSARQKLKDTLIKYNLI
ncbi:MAG: dihydrodipicolinate synthase family protein, partial [Oscillospiraceae bacterium]